MPVGMKNKLLSMTGTDRTVRMPVDKANTPLVQMSYDASPFYRFAMMLRTVIACPGDIDGIWKGPLTTYKIFPSLLNDLDKISVTRFFKNTMHHLKSGH